ncbi:hypothetical protein ACFE04_011397 [Oxalis oulophora]
MARKRKITMVSKEGATGSSSTTQGSAGGAPPSGQAASSTEGTRQERKREKMAKENDRVRPCRGDLYVATHKEKDVNYINDAAQESVTQMENIMNEERSKRELQQLENPDLTFEIDVDWDNDEYTQVKGNPKNDRVNAKEHLSKEVIRTTKRLSVTIYSHLVTERPSPQTFCDGALGDGQIIDADALSSVTIYPIGLLCRL